MTDLRRHVPQVALTWDEEVPGARWRVIDGTLVFADISGFTALSEQLARKGREGAEQIAETIGGSFEHVLQVAYASGGSVYFSVKTDPDYGAMARLGYDGLLKIANEAAGVDSQYGAGTVLRAYGWDDLAEAANPVFLSEDTETEFTYQGRLFWPSDFRDEVLARLLDLNRQYAEQERLSGAAAEKKAKGTRGRKSKAKSTTKESSVTQTQQDLNLDV